MSGYTPPPLGNKGLPRCSTCNGILIVAPLVGGRGLVHLTRPRKADLPSPPMRPVDAFDDHRVTITEPWWDVSGGAMRTEVFVRDAVDALR